MKRNIYGKKMFIADLIIVSLWALFVWHFAWGRIMAPAMIGLRLALCFMLYRTSRWTFFNAMLFTAMYIGLAFDMPCDSIVFRPILKIAYVICCLSGYSEWAVQAFSHVNGTTAEIPVRISMWLYTLWLTIIPIVCSWKFKSILPLFRNRKRILWYVGAVVSLFLYVYFTDRDASLFVGGLFMSLTPLAYRCIYRKGKPTLLQSILQDIALLLYMSVAAIFFSAILIGLYEVNAAKPFASLLFPIALYIIALKGSYAKSIRTTPAVLLGVAGFLSMLVYNRGHETVIMLLCVSGLLSLIGVYLFYRQSRSIFTTLLLLLANVFVLPMSLLGYNPYAAIDVNEVTSLRCNRTCHQRGLYEFKQYGRVGLRDRYGIVLYANYQDYEYLDGRNDYMVLYSDSHDWHEYAIEDIYDLKHRRNILPDDVNGLYGIEKIRENVYAIYDDERNRIFTLRLPGAYNGLYNPEMRLIDFKEEKSNDVILPSDLSDMAITKSDDGKLTPEMTISVNENTNIAAHKDKLLRIIYGMMFQFGSQARNAYKHEEYKGRLGIFTAFNPTPEHYLSMTIMGNASENEDDKYDITIVTALFKEGEEPQGCCTKIGTFNTAEIEDIMSIEDNAQMILDDFIESVEMIYSGNLPKQ